jgi:hypothetical protein
LGRARLPVGGRKYLRQFSAKNTFILSGAVFNSRH